MYGDAGASASPHAEAIAAAVRDDAHLPTPSDDEDCDDLYGDVNVGFLPLLPLSPSPTPTSPPETPSPGRSPSPSPPLYQAPAPEPQPAPEPEPQPKPTTLKHQPPPPPAPRYQLPQPQPGGGDASSSSPSCAALYVSDLPWWTTDAEVEAALAPHAAAASLHGLHFYADKHNGKSRGVCRADFLHPAAAASAAAALHGCAFHGRHCVASLSRQPPLHRLSDDSDSYAEAARAPNRTRCRNGGRGRGASNATTVRGNVGPALGDRPILAPPTPRSMAPRPLGPPLGGMMGGGGFQSVGQYNAGMGTGMMPSAVAPHVNTAFLAAGGMAMRGPGVWRDQAMAGGLWGAQQPWNFRGCQMHWQQLMPPAQQLYGNGDYGKERGMRRERPVSKSEERGIGNVRSYPERRQSGRDGSDWYKEHDCKERGRHRERVLEKGRERESHWDERDRHGGEKRRYQEYTERYDFNRRGRAKSRSQSKDGDHDDHPRRRR
ncbi:uncharacterized protein LOC133889158 [Phragmites australis]|uniref:uncharacterized protein LOC133889158 n=1 Tax=Phragmites australis TaxID=29695 RepID=UPI002D77289F|nr:uncharacterized protein LOC133889158 [Phragmites australis]